ncbi:MAG: hypothetical protein BACD_02607 [Bacteroides rodentium]
MRSGVKKLPLMRRIAFIDHTLKNTIPYRVPYFIRYVIDPARITLDWTHPPL